MQKSPSLIVCLVVLCGCTHDQRPGLGLQKLASGLEQPWPGSREASMTMTVRDSGGHPVLHCRLQSPLDKSLALDRSRLPWKQPIFFRGTFVTSTGRTFAIAPGVITYLVGEPDPFSLATTEAVEGDFQPKYLPGNPMVGPRIPQDEDALLLWSYDLPTYGEAPPSQDLPLRDRIPMQRVRLIGITYIPKEAMRLLEK